jgi:hypothetical protein
LQIEHFHVQSRTPLSRAVVCHAVDKIIKEIYIKLTSFNLKGHPDKLFL